MIKDRGMSMNRSDAKQQDKNRGLKLATINLTKMAEQRRSVGPPLSALTVALLAIVGFTVFSFLPQIMAKPRLAESFWAAAGALFVFLAFLRRQTSGRRALSYEIAPKPVHYVQLVMHSCVYAYWGWYWPEVYRHVPLIAAQVMFVYALDMMVCWSRRDKWILGFGPFPIVLSTNLFLWFRDDWFFLQFLMLAVGVLGKEFLKWKRDGRSTHIFNPSALSLFIFSVGLLLTHSTSITWGEQISTTFHRPPNIYFEIFVIGLVVQALFSVTLVTLSAAASLYVLNLGYTHATGVYHFVDTNIPPAVFLGLHLLVTDPATSPRKTFGKIVFGTAYGAGVFALYGLLGWLGAPTFYDKLLCVPALNLTVRMLDRASDAVTVWLSKLRFRPLAWAADWSPQQSNFAYMGVWIGLFGVMSVTGFVGGKQPGSSPAFWENACEQGRWHACRTFAHSLDIACQGNSGPACFTLGMLLNDNKEVPRDAPGAARSFGRACDLGLPYGCMSLSSLVSTDGSGVLSVPCQHGDGVSCSTLGTLYLRGQGMARDQARALDLFRKSCAAGWPRGCGLLGESYLFGQGASINLTTARETLEKACALDDPPSCFNTGLMYRQGAGGAKDELLAEKRLEQSCAGGFRLACQALRERPAVQPAAAIPTPR